jgi:hypothetical protein
MAKLTHLVTIIDPRDPHHHTQEIAKADILEVCQKAVGGWIETVGYFRKFNGRRCTAYVNEEGLLKRLPFNQEATRLWREQYQWATTLVGPIAIVQTLEKAK